MDNPFLSVLKYLLKKGGIENDDESIEAFFENGLSFPQFIAMIFQVDEIPQIMKTAHSKYFKKVNNDLALQFLFGKNQTIKDLKPNFQTESDKTNLISLILTHQIYKMNSEKIIIRCNEILNIQNKNLKDIMNPAFLLSLLNALTGNSNAGNNNTENDIFPTLINSFFKAGVPLIVNKDSFDIENPSIFLIQIQLIFEIFPEKMKNFSQKKISEKLSEKVVESENSDENTETINDDDDTNIYANVDTINIDDSKIDEKGLKTFKPEDYNSDKNSHDSFVTNLNYSTKNLYPGEACEIESLLLTIGCIAEMLKICPREKCTSFEFTLFNNFIPLFVMRYLKIKKIDNLKKIERKVEENTQLMHQEIENIKIVIEYLKKSEKKNPKYDLLIFDFDSPYLFVNSAKLFFITFLNSHFIKYTRIEMMERCHILLGDLTWFTKEKLYNERLYDIFAGLLLFIQFVKQNKNKEKQIKIKKEKEDESENDGNENSDNKEIEQSNSNYCSYDEIIKKLKSEDNNFCNYFNELLELFQQTGIPMVIGNSIIDDLYHDSDSPDSIYYQQSDKELPNSIIYQLQFIFDVLDSLKCLSVIELLKSKNNKLKKLIKIETTDESKKTMELIDKIMPGIKSKIRYLILKQKIKRNDTDEIKKVKEKQKYLNDDEIKPQTFIDRQISGPTIKTLSKSSIKEKPKDKTTKTTLINDDAQKFWNPDETNYLIENGVLYSTDEPKQSSTDFYNKMHETDATIQDKMNLHKDKKLRKKTDQSAQEQLLHELNLQMSKRSSSYSFETKLYKFLFFDESKMQWVFDPEIFDTFSSDKKINIETSRTPIIFYFNSNEDDLIKINSYFIMGSYPILDQNQIYIYPLCEKQLSKLNTTFDFSNQDKMFIKPIFLLLHVPKEKKKLPFLHTVISQLYIFLSKICDVSLCIYNESFIKYQIEILNDILAVTNHAYNENNEKLKIVFLKNNPNAMYNYEYDQQVHQLSFLEMQNGQKIQYYLANFENFDTYKPFMDNLDNILLETTTTFLDVKNCFNDFNLAQFSGMYIHIYSFNRWKDELKKVIENRFQILKSKDPNFDNNPEFVLYKLHEEFTTFSSLTDKDFRIECSNNYSLMRKTFTQVSDNSVVDELRKSSDKNLEILQKYLTDGNYWTKNQIRNMIDGNARFLKKEYFNIIKAIADPKLFPLVYQDNKDILDAQIKESTEKIEKFSKNILDDFEHKNSIKNVTAEESSKKGTNYSLKETENLRELKIEVKTADKLETVIEQDF